MNLMSNYEDYRLYGVKLIEKNPFIQNAYIDDNEEYIEGKDFLENYKVKKNISVTPYIYNDCSANCKFCSEQLIRNGKAMVCNEQASDYAKKLSRILKNLYQNKLFLSLSGKEPSESLEFVELILKCFSDFEKSGGVITDKVMYSNLSGVVNNFNKVVELIECYGITRIECSRHHYDQDINQSIMRFKESEIQYNNCFSKLVMQLLEKVDLKLVCVVQREGINNIEDLKKYIVWAKSLGIGKVVFRELAMFENAIEDNVTARYIRDNRVEIMDFIENLNKEFKPQKVTRGYYYMSFEYEYLEMKINFEMSDYEEMIKKHESQMVHKLIYYPNGKLCLDWNMNREVF